MMGIDLETLSIEELWALHEEIASVLSTKLSAEKRKLDKRLDDLGEIKGTSARQRRPFPRFIRSFAIQKRLTKHGRVAEGSRAG